MSAMDDDRFDCEKFATKSETSLPEAPFPVYGLLRPPLSFSTMGSTCAWTHANTGADGMGTMYAERTEVVGATSHVAIVDDDHGHRRRMISPKILSLFGRLMLVMGLLLMACGRVEAKTCDLAIVDQYMSPTPGFVQYKFFNNGPDACDAFVAIGVRTNVAGDINDPTTFSFSPKAWAPLSGGPESVGYNAYATGNHAAECNANGGFFAADFFSTGQYWACDITGLAIGEVLSVTANFPLPQSQEENVCPGAAITMKDYRSTGYIPGLSIFYTPDLTSTIDDPDVSNNRKSTGCPMPGIPSIKLVATKTGPATAAPGSLIQWTIQVRNAGGQSASAFTVTDALPPGVTFVSATGSGYTCTNSGQSVTCSSNLLTGTSTSQIIVKGYAPNTVGPITNTCTLAGGGGERDSTGCTATTQITAAATVTVTKTATPNPVLAGNPITWTLNASNAGPNAATNVVVSDTLPAGVTNIAASGAGWSCSLSGQTVTCNRASLAVGSSPITVTGNAPSTTGNITNTCVANGDAGIIFDVSSCSATTTVNPNSAIVLSKTASASSLGAGKPISWTITATNNGPSAATNAVVTDTVPAGVTGITASGFGWGCSVSGQIVSCNRSSMPVGSSSITINGNAPTTVGTIVNTCMGTIASGGSVNSSACTAPTSITPVSSVTVTKTATPNPVLAGNTITWTITATNAGPNPATNVVVSDTVPAGVTNIAASGAGWTCSVVGQAVSCSRPTLAVGSATITVTGKAPSSTGNITNTCVASADAGATFNVAGCNVTTTVNANSSVVLTKTASAASLGAGSPISWTITATNNGPSPATNAVVTDSVPAGVTGISATGTGWTCSVSGQTVTCSRTSMPVGSSNITISGTAPTATGTITNTCTGTITSGGSVDSSACSAPTTITPVSRVTVTKTATPNPVQAGQPITWTLSVANAGPNPASNALVKDTLPAGVTNIAASGAGWTCTVNGQNVSCSRTSLPVGNSTITVTGKAPTTPGDITNTCVASGASGATFDVSNCRVTTTVTESAQVLLTKRASASSLPMGSAISWTITANNFGPSIATNVQVVDTVPAGVTSISAAGTGGWNCAVSGQTVTCTIASLSVGSSAVTISGFAPNVVGPITNTCTGTVSSTSTIDSSGCSAVTDITAVANVTMTKEAAPNPVQAGTPITWTLTATNTGPNTATNVTVSDTLPAGVTGIIASGPGWNCTVSGLDVSCTRATMPVGSSYVSVVGYAPTTTGNITNTCVASGDPGVVFDLTSCHADSEVTDYSHLIVSKTASASTIGTELPITWTINVQNVGPTAGTNVVITDTVPVGVTNIAAAGPGWTCGISGQVVTCTAATLPVGVSSISVSGTTPSEAGTITNVCTARADTEDGSDSKACNVSTEVVEHSSISVKKTSSAATVTAGGPISWTITATNSGPNDATGVVITDQVPMGVTNVAASGNGFTCTVTGNEITCTAATFAVGTKTITVTGTAPSVGGEITNTCMATGSESTTFDNSECYVTTTIEDASAVSLTKSVSPNPVLAGSQVTWTINVKNDGPSAATNVVVDDAVPASVTSVAANWVGGGPGLACSVTNNNVHCTAASLGVGTKSVKITGLAPATPGPLANTCTASADASSSVDVDNCTVTTTVDVNAHVVATKEASAAFVPAGMPLSWTIHVENSGPSDATDVQIVDTIPTGVTGVSASANGWTCSVSGQTLTCDIPSLIPGTSDIHIDATAPVAPGPIENTCVVSTPDDALANSDACRVTSTIGANAQVTVGKTATPNPVTAGGEITWLLTVTNNGPSVANNVEITDTMPAGVTSITAESDVFTCGLSGQVVTCVSPSMAVGVSTITIKGNAPAEPGPLRNICVASADAGQDVNTDSCDVTTSVTELADVEVRKIADADNVPAGTAIGWTIEVENHGPSMARNIVVGDDVPDGVTNVQVNSTDGFSCSLNGQQVTCTIGQLPIGVAHIHVTGIAPLVAQTVTNTCSAVSDSTPAPDTDACTSDVVVDSNSGISMEKTVSSPTVTAGGPMYWEIAVTNIGPGTATDVVVDDPLPAGVSGVTASGSGWSCTATDTNVHCNRATLAAGTSVIRIDATAPMTLGELFNTCVVSSDGIQAEHSCEVTTEVVESASITTRKVASASSLNFGEAISWTIEVTNHGPTQATGVTIVDELPEGLSNVLASSSDGWSCTGTTTLTCEHADSLNVGTTQIHISANAPETAGQITNTCHSVLDDGNSGLSHDDSACQARTEIVRDSAISAVKHGPTSGTAQVNQPIEWTIEVTNDGPSAATDVQVVDHLPAGVTNASAIGTTDAWNCSISGADITCALPRMEVGTSVIKIGAIAPSQPGMIENVCVLSAAGVAEPDDSACHDSTNIIPSSNITVYKTSEPPAVEVNGTLDWVISVTNDGPNDASNVSVVDHLPAGVTIVETVAAGWSCASNGTQITCTTPNLAVGTSEIRIRAKAPSVPGEIENTCVLSGANVTVNDFCQVTTTVIGGTPSLHINKRATQDPVVVGSPIEWLITVTNDGTGSAHNLVVTDTLPAGVTQIAATGTGWSCGVTAQQVSCSMADFPVGESVIHVTGLAPLVAGPLVNTCVIEAEGVTVDGECRSTTVIGGSPALSVTKHSTAAVVEAGGPIEWIISVTNTGTAPAENVVIGDHVPDGVTNLVVSGTGWNCTGLGQFATCSIDAIAAGATSEIHVSGTAPLTAGQLSNVCVIQAGATPVDDHCQSTTEVHGTPDLHFHKRTTTSEVAAGGDVEWIITVNNSGNAEATDVEIGDTLVDGVANISAYGDGWSCTVTGQAVSCYRAGIAPGESTDIHVHGTAPDREGPLLNVCVAKSAGISIRADECSSTTVVTPRKGGNVAISKTAHILSSKSQDDPTLIEFHVKVTNTSSLTMRNVEVVDVWPGLIQLVSQGASGLQMDGFQCAMAGGNVKCTAAELAPNSSSELVLYGAAERSDKRRVITNVAVVTAAGDQDPSDNRAQASVTLEGSGGPGASSLPVPTLDWRGLLFLLIVLSSVAYHHRKKFAA